MSESRKQERKEGIKYYICEHLEKGLMDDEMSVIWLGDNTRVIVCPLCAKLEFGNQMTNMYIFMGKQEKFIIKFWRHFREVVFKSLIKEKKERLKEIEND